MNRILRLAILPLFLATMASAGQAAALVAVQGAPPDVQLAASKVSWDLSLLRTPGDRFVGTTEDGSPVIVPATDASLQALSQRPGVAALQSVASDRVEAINEAVVFYTGDEPPKELPGGLEVTAVHAEGRFVVAAASAGGEGLSFEDVRSLVRSDTVRFVEPNYAYRLVEAPDPPNDPEFPKLWGMVNIHAPDAWKRVSSSPIVVAVIDSGVDYTHPDLAENIWTNQGEVPRNGLDDDRNGFVDDVHGYDFVGNDGDPSDGHSHGTHCAGTIAAVGNNGAGVVGVSWDLDIMAVQIFDENGSPARADDIARAIDYATANGARVLSNSWSGPNRSAAIQAAIERSRDRGALFVAAASNDGADNDRTPQYPASYATENILAVLSIDRSDVVSSFSNYGRTSVDLGAPGGEIWSTVLRGGYGPKWGTSMATPHVAGAAALVWGHPQYAAADWRTVRDALLDHARPLPSLSGKCVTGAALDVAFLGGAGEIAEVEGTLRRPSFAMGGGTTGTTVVTEEGPIDLDVRSLGADVERLEALDGKRVEVRGSIRVESAVENPSRKVMEVLAIEERK